jgi:hypothetical protein
MGALKPMMIRTVLGGSDFVIAPNTGGSIAAPIAKARAFTASFLSIDSWSASTDIPSGGPPANSSKGVGPSDCGTGQPALLSISHSSLAHCRASGTCLAYSMKTLAFRASFNSAKSFSRSGMRGVPAFTMNCRKRAVSLFNSAIFKSLASSMIFRYGAASRAAPNSIASVTITPKNAIVPINSQSQYHHVALASSGFSTESPWWLDAGLASGLGALALLIRRRNRR